jgi:putative ATP-dependent endonuclease of OLD family
MKLAHLRVCNFRCFGEVAIDIALEDTTFILGPNGSGKGGPRAAFGCMASCGPSQSSSYIVFERFGQ